MKKLLTRNLGLKLASLLLAFVLWFLVAQIYDPKDTVTFNNIQVRLINTELLDEEGKVYEVLDNSNLVRVTVTGPQSIVKSELRRSDIVAEADMSKLTDINTIAITYYCENISNDSVEIKGNHDSVRLNVEDKTSKWIKLESNTIGDVASGYMIGNVTLDQTNIEVTGPKSAISQVDHAGVDINVTDSTTSLSANVDIKLYDADDNELVLESVKKNVDSAYMTVEVLATKEVPVEIEYMVTKDNREPYRMMTSRAEYRLLLRQDNADLRLRKKGYEIGLISQQEYDALVEKEELIDQEIQRLKNTSVGANKEIQQFLEESGSSTLKTAATLAELICRPELGYAALAPIDKERKSLPRDVVEQVEIEIKYEGYIIRQKRQVEQYRKMEKKIIPENLDYDEVPSLRLEARQKLKEFRPISVGQASRISGVSPADISVLLVYLEHYNEKKS